MNVKTMEGLAGASASINMISTPMSVAKEAERKGETDKMIRALGYASELKDQAGEYGEKASEGMKLDGEEAKKQEKLLQEKLVQARKEERDVWEKQLEEKAGKAEDFDTVEFGEEGRHYAETAAAVPSASEKTQDMTYQCSREAVEAVQETGANLDVQG